MNNRIPAYFQLENYNISPEDVVQGTLHCAPNDILSRVVIMPSWRVEIFEQVAAEIAEVVPGVVYQLEYQGQWVTLIRSGIGAAQTGDVMLALGCTSCDVAIFTGSMGGLVDGMQVGDLVAVEQSLCGDGFSRYLDTEIVPGDCFLQFTQPDRNLTEHIKNRAVEACCAGSIPLHQGAVFSTDSILGQFFRLDYLKEEHHCIGIEMETAAAFRAAKLIGIKVGALLQISDLPQQRKSLYSGRSDQEMERRKSIRQETLARVVLDSALSY